MKAPWWASDALEALGHHVVAAVVVCTLAALVFGWLT